MSSSISSSIGIRIERDDDFLRIKEVTSPFPLLLSVATSNNEMKQSDWMIVSFYLEKVEHFVPKDTHRMFVLL